MRTGGVENGPFLFLCVIGGQRLLTAEIAEAAQSSRRTSSDWPSVFSWEL